MAIPEGPNPQLPQEHSDSLPQAHQRTGEMGSHSVTAEGKSAGSYLVSAIKAVAKALFTGAFCVPLGISYLASKAAFTEGRLGGKADRVATKVARFFGEFYGTLKPSLAIKSTYHEFLKAHPHLNAEDRKTLDKLLEIMSSDRPDEEKKKRNSRHICQIAP